MSEPVKKPLQQPESKLYVCTDRAFAPGAPLEKSEERCAQMIEKAKRFFA